MKRLPPPPKAPPLPARPLGRKRVGWNDPPLSATPLEQARFLNVLETFKVSYCAGSQQGYFTAGYKDPDNGFVCFLGGPNPPEEAI